MKNITTKTHSKFLLLREPLVFEIKDDDTKIEHSHKKNQFLSNHLFLVQKIKSQMKIQFLSEYIFFRNEKTTVRKLNTPRNPTIKLNFKTHSVFILKGQKDN